jgi:hypothetical protein
MHGPGLVDACVAIALAAAAVYHLYIDQLADMPSGKRALRAALMVVTLFYSGMLLAGVSDSKDHLVSRSRLEEAETKLWKMEQAMGTYFQCQI